MVGTIPDHSIALVRSMILPGAIAAFEPVEIPAAGNPVGFITVACREEVVGFRMGGVAGNVAGVVEQIMLGGYLTLFVHVSGPGVEVGGPADEVTGGDRRARVECREEQFPVEAVYAAAEPSQAIGNVLAVEQLLKSGELASVHAVPP